MTSIADIYRNVVLTVMTIVLVFIALERRTATVRAQSPAQMTRITLKDGVLGNLPGQVRALACPSANECYIVIQQ